MATNIAVQPMPANGTALNGATMQAADVAGNEFSNDGKTLMYIENTDAANPHLVTILGQPSPDSGRSTPNVTLTVAANGHACAGPFKTANFNTATGAASVTAADAAVTIALVSYKNATSD